MYYTALARAPCALSRVDVYYGPVKVASTSNCRLSEIGQETPLILPHVIKTELENVAEEKTAPELLRGKAYELLLTAQEMIVRQNMVAVALRPDIGFWKYVMVDSSSMDIKGVETAAYLAFKEKLSGQSMLCTVLMGA